MSTPNQPPPAGPHIRSAVASVPPYVPGRPPAPIDGDPWLGKLSSNENPQLPPPHVLDAIRAAADVVNRYPDASALRLRTALAQAAGIEPDQVMIGPGSVALLYYLFQACCEPGDTVVYPWRSFEGYPLAVRLAGATPIEVPLAPGTHHDFTAMLNAIGQRTRAVLVCTPNNPTGPVADPEALTRFVHAVPSNVLVTIDEAYLEFVTAPHADALELFKQSLAAGRTNIVILRTFSKAYSLAGLRVGYAFAAASVIAALNTVAIPFGVNQFAQDAALAAFGDQAAMRERVEPLIAERDRVLAALRSDGWQVPDSQANFVWLPLGPASEEFAAAAFAQGLALRPFAGDGVRVSIGSPGANDRFIEFARAWHSSHLG